jgi:hypothetical protein
MPTNPTDHAIRTRVDAFLAELSAIVRKAALDSVQEILGGTAPKRRRGPGRPGDSGRRGTTRPRKSARVARPSRGIRRSAADLEKITVRVLAHVRSHPGHRLEQIGKALQTDTAILKRPIQNLLAEKQLRTQGRKRGTTYFAGSGAGAARKGKDRRPARQTRKAKVRGHGPGTQARRTEKNGAARARRSASRASDAAATLEQAERMAAG